MGLRSATLLLTAAAFMASPAASSAARSPVTRDGRPAQLVAGYVGTPTAFAFSPHNVFMSDGTVYPLGIGGVYVLRRGTARRLAHSPALAYGLAWQHHALFISAGQDLLAWRGWNGRKFTRRQTIYSLPQRSVVLTGLALGPDGRLYVGVEKGAPNNHGPAAAGYDFAILSMTTQGTDVRIVAQGIQGPWQLLFPPGSSSPFVTDVGHNRGGRPAPDLLLRVRQGQDYGFPTCRWTRTSFCQGFARPLRFFAPRSDPLGLASLGQRLYISEFGVGTPAQVISIPLSGRGKARVVLSGFPPGRHIDGLGAHEGWIYVGETAAGKRRFGSVWRFAP